MTNNVRNLFEEHDPRIDALYKDIEDVVYKRASGILNISTVVGVLEMVKQDLIEEHKNE